MVVHALDCLGLLAYNEGSGGARSFPGSILMSRLNRRRHGRVERLRAPRLDVPPLRRPCRRAGFPAHLQREGSDRLAAGQDGAGRQDGLRRRPVRGQGRRPRDHRLEGHAPEDDRDRHGGVVRRRLHPPPGIPRLPGCQQRPPPAGQGLRASAPDPRLSPGRPVQDAQGLQGRRLERDRGDRHRHQGPLHLQRRAARSRPRDPRQGAPRPAIRDQRGRIPEHPDQARGASSGGQARHPLRRPGARAPGARRLFAAGGEEPARGLLDSRRRLAGGRQVGASRSSRRRSWTRGSSSSPPTTGSCRTSTWGPSCATSPSRSAGCTTTSPSTAAIRSGCSSWAIPPVRSSPRWSAPTIAT